MLAEGGDMLDGVNATDDFLQSTNKVNVPPHELTLWEGAVCMIARNLNARLKNGTRVVVLKVSARTVRIVRACDWRGPEAVYEPDEVYRVPRVLFEWPLPRLQVKVQRRQFPLRLAYAVTMNKAQGQTLERVVVDLRALHGRLVEAGVRDAVDGAEVVEAPSRRHFEQLP